MTRHDTPLALHALRSRSARFVVASLGLVVALVLPARGDGAGAPGALVVAGGGATGPEVTARALALGGGATARVLIVPQASADPDAGGASARFWREAGAATVSVLDLTDREAALSAVRSATLIWIPGGDQRRLMEALRGTGVSEAIVSRHRDGATVGGTSAGAAAMSRVMLTGDADLERIAGGATGTASGLGLWPAAIVDQHVLTRRRLNRLIATVLDHPDLIGVGIDERTAALVTGSRLEVIGRGQVVVVDARRAKERVAPPGEPSAAKDLRVHVLRAGMQLDLARP